MRKNKKTSSRGNSSGALLLSNNKDGTANNARRSKQEAQGRRHSLNSKDAEEKKRKRAATVRDTLPRITENDDQSNESTEEDRGLLFNSRNQVPISEQLQKGPIRMTAHPDSNNIITEYSNEDTMTEDDRNQNNSLIKHQHNSRQVSMPNLGGKQ